jgi:hypothetical protein
MCPMFGIKTILLLQRVEWLSHLMGAHPVFV